MSGLSRVFIYFGILIAVSASASAHTTTERIIPRPLHDLLLYDKALVSAGVTENKISLISAYEEFIYNVGTLSERIDLENNIEFTVLATGERCEENWGIQSERIAWPNTLIEVHCWNSKGKETQNHVDLYSKSKFWNFFGITHFVKRSLPPCQDCGRPPDI